MEGVTPADRRQVIELSERCNAKMRQLYPAVKGTHSNWFRLFKRIDGDGSGKITVAEFTKLLRKVLQLNLSNLSNEELKAAWCALDTDQSGYITAGEFGQWMGLGAKAVTANGPTTLQQQRSTAAFYNRHEEALSAAGVGSAGVDAVLLVGGAARLDAVAKHAARALGGVPTLCMARPEEAVALGAATVASRMQEAEFGG